jgi:hypothetical protein
MPINYVRYTHCLQETCRERSCILCNLVIRKACTVKTGLTYVLVETGLHFGQGPSILSIFSALLEANTMTVFKTSHNTFLKQDIPLKYVTYGHATKYNFNN